VNAPVVNGPECPSTRTSTRIGYALFAAYAVYVLAAVFAQKNGFTLPFALGDVGEFCLFFAATVFFVAGFVQADANGGLPPLPRVEGWGAGDGARFERKDGSHTLTPNPSPRGRGEPANRWLHALDENAERYAMLVFYVFVCAVIVQEVIRRFVFNFSSAWAQETAQYAFIYLGYVGAAFAVKERAHIRFDILLQRLPARLHGWVYMFAEICTLAFAIIAAYWCLHTVAQLLEFGGTTPVLRVNKVWAEAALPIGFALMIVRCLQMIWRDWQDIRAGRPAYVGKSMFEE
jgi:TRAP-type C4-dicarboxylate transport system permease small subunit